MACTGIRSDVDFLFHRLRSHATRKHWFRYDVLPPPSRFVQMVREVLLDFMGYDRSLQVCGRRAGAGGVGGASPSEDNENDDGDENNNGGGSSSNRAGRPLGLSAMVIVPGQLEQGRRLQAEIHAVEANGSTERYVARAMGMGSATMGNKLLSERWKAGMTRHEARDMMRGVLERVGVEQGWLEEDEEDEEDGGSENDLGRWESTSARSNGKFVLVCETVTSRGVDTNVIPL